MMTNQKSVLNPCYLFFVTTVLIKLRVYCLQYLDGPKRKIKKTRSNFQNVCFNIHVRIIGTKFRYLPKNVDDLDEGQRTM